MFQLLFLSLLILSYQQQPQKVQQPPQQAQQPPQQTQQPQQVQQSKPAQQPQQFQQPVCVSGQICPIGKGVCIVDTCQCNEGFYTLYDQTLQPGQQQIFCNYQQKSLYQPLVLEVFLPGVGHISVGHYWLGIIKIVLFLTYFSLTFYLYGNFEMPQLFTYAFEKCGAPVYSPRSGTGNSGKFLGIVKELSGIAFFIMYFADLFLYKMEFYNDGYGVPFA